MSPGKRRQSEIDDTKDVKLARCKRAPPPSPEMHTVPLYAPDISSVQSQGGRHSTPHTALLDHLDLAPFETLNTHEALTRAEMLDVETLIHHSPESKRGSLSVADCIGRGLNKASNAETLHPAALEYFVRLRAELHRASGNSERATNAHGAMLEGWQQKMAAWLGSSIGTFDSLASLVDQVMARAESVGRLTIPSHLRQDIRTTICAAGFIANSAQITPPASFVDAPIEEPYRPEVTADETGHIAHSEVNKAGDPDKDTNKPSPGRSLRERFPDPRSFFVHHARKAKRKHLGERWKSKVAKRAAIAEIDDEWSSMPGSMKIVWTEMHGSLLSGNEEYLLQASASTALFVDGHARSASNLTASNVLRSELATSEASSPLPGPTQRRADNPRLPPFGPVKVPYKVVDSPEKKVYLRLSMKAEADDVATACRMALGGIQRDTATDDATYLSHSIFIISFCSVRMARRLATKTVSVDSMRPVAWSYPPTPPSVFVARIEILGAKAIRHDQVHAHLTRAFPDESFHLRREKAVAATHLSWLIMFQRTIGLLRFSIPMMQTNTIWKQVQFEPAMSDSACQVCTSGHSTHKCDLLAPLSAEDLGIAIDHPEYLVRPPRVKM